jgi:serine phosphatase RsbU (regulator of sigma subunit)/predicted hydrocarbon binding protein
VGSKVQSQVSYENIEIDKEIKEKIEELIRFSVAEAKKQKFLSLQDINCPMRFTLGRRIDLVYYRIIRLIALRESLGSRLASKILYQAGYQVAQQINCTSYEQLQEILNQFMLGKTIIVEQREDFIVFEEDECATCSGLPNIGEAVCDFESGFIAGSLRQITGKDVVVEETKCWGLGDKICRFEATIGVNLAKDKEIANNYDPIEMIAVLTGKAVNAIDLARKLEKMNNRYKQDLEMARTVQLSLLPSKLPQVDGLEISTCYLSANEVGGDFYDVFSLSDGKIGIIIADVAGHGTASALLTASVKAIIDRLEHLYEIPGKFLSELNQQLYSLLNKNDTVNFVTAAYCCVDVKNRQMNVANAGHPYPIIVNSRGEIGKMENIAGGIPLGIIKNFEYSEEVFHLNKGDLVLLYTDGLVECRNENNDQLGEKKILELLKEKRDLSSEQINSFIMEELKKHLQDSTLTDDINSIIFKLT